MERLELDRPRELDELVSTTVSLWIRHFAVFFTLALAVVAPFGLLIEGVWAGTLTDPDAKLSTAAFAGSVVLDGLVASTLITAVHVVAVQGLGRGEVPSVGGSLRAAAPAFLPVVLILALYTLGTMLMTLLLILPGVWFGIQYYFGAQAAIIEGRRGTDALKRSGELVNGNWWRTYGALFASGVLAWLVSMLFTVLAGVVADSTGAGSLSGPIATTVVILGNALVNSFTALVGTLLFFDLRARATLRPRSGVAPSGPGQDARVNPGELERREELPDARTAAALGGVAPLTELTASRALRRQLAVAGGLLVALALLVLGARLGGISLATLDRPLFVLGGLAAVAVFRVARSLWRVSREGIGAVLPGPPEPLDPAPRSELDAHDRFLVAEKFRFFGVRYELSLLAADGRSPGDAVAVVDREAFRLKERLEALKPDADSAGFVDARQAQELQRRVFRLEAQQILDAGGRYRIDSPDGDRIGELRKVFAASMFRATWEVWDGAGTLVAIAQERSLAVALLRRTVGVVPVLGELLGLLPIGYHVDLHAPLNGQRIATVTRLRTFRDRYVLTIDGDPRKVIDRRLALALAVSLDAL